MQAIVKAALHVIPIMRATFPRLMATTALSQVSHVGQRPVRACASQATMQLLLMLNPQLVPSSSCCTTAVKAGVQYGSRVSLPVRCMRLLQGSARSPLSATRQQMTWAHLGAAPCCLLAVNAITMVRGLQCFSAMQADCPEAVCCTHLQ